MVSISLTPTEAFDRIETNLKYLLDLDLSDDQILSDPLALALYYHFAEKNEIQNVNRLSLVAWARTYCYSRLVDREFSKKKDTETTAAILAYATLRKDKGYPEDKKQGIEQNIEEILKTETGKDRLYFGRPNLTSIILQAANEAGVPIQDEEKILEEVASRYKNSRTLNNLIGLPFLAELLIKKKEQLALGELVETAKHKLKDHLLEYDDKLYIISTLWKYHKATNTLRATKTTTESVILETPIMVSDIINKGDISDITVRNGNLRISRLYKAVLIDLLSEYKNNAADLWEKEMDRRYAGEFALKWGAFVTFSVIPLLVTGVTGFLLKDRLWQGLTFWILQRTEITAVDLIGSTALTLLVMYLITFSVTGTYSLHTSIVKKSIAKDLRVWEHYKTHQKRAAKWFVKSVLIALAVAVATRFAGTAMQKYITGKG
jgi:hypothetical protein